MLTNENLTASDAIGALNFMTSHFTDDNQPINHVELLLMESLPEARNVLFNATSTLLGTKVPRELSLFVLGTAMGYGWGVNKYHQHVNLALRGLEKAVDLHQSDHSPEKIRGMRLAIRLLQEANNEEDEEGN